MLQHSERVVLRAVGGTACTTSCLAAVRAAVTQLAWSPAAAGLYMGRAITAGLPCASENAFEFAVPGLQDASQIRLRLSLSCPEEQKVCRYISGASTQAVSYEFPLMGREIPV